MTDSQLYSDLQSEQSLKQSLVWVVIPAAGSGQRMKSEIPKQFLKMHGKTILEYTIECFQKHEKLYLPENFEFN